MRPDAVGLPPRRARYIVRRYVTEVVQPRLQQDEDAWWKVDAYSATQWNIYRIMHMNLPLQSTQAWSQLRLQGYFSGWVASATEETPPCRFCSCAVRSDALHLFLDCPEAQNIIVAAAVHTSLGGYAPIDIMAASLNPQCYEDTLAAIKIAGVLAQVAAAVSNQ